MCRVKTNLFITVTPAQSPWKRGTIAQFVMTLISVLLAIKKMDIRIKWRDLDLILMVGVEKLLPPVILKRPESYPYKDVFKVWCMLVSAEMPTVVFHPVIR